MNKKLSIIIPVYNVELFVEKCLRSCAEQDISTEEYEIIVINDGSTDNSLQIIKKVIKDYSNIVLFDKPNGGVSSARNVGLNIATGNYCWFVDSDDWIAANCLNELILKIERDQLDVMQIGFLFVESDGLLATDNTNNYETPILTNEDYFNGMHFDGHCFSSIFKRNISAEHSIKFDEDLIYFEDAVFFLTILHHAKNIKKINYCPYFYRKRSDSATSLYREKEYFTCMNIYLQHSPITSYIKFQQREICWVILSFIRISNMHAVELSAKLKNTGYKTIPLLGNSLKTNIIIAIYNYYGPLGILLIRLQKFLSNAKLNMFQSIKHA